MSNNRSKFNSFSSRRRRNIDKPVDNDENSQLHKMVIEQNIKEVTKLLKIGAGVNIVNIRKQSPVYSAIENKNNEIIDLLINYGARFNIVDTKGRTPLMFAIEKKCDNKFLDYLLSKGDFLNIKNRARTSVMHIAAANDNVEILKYLKEKKLSFNKKNRKGETPLHYAVENKAYEALQFLIDNKANSFLRTNNIESLLHIAARLKDEKSVKILLSDPIIRKNINRFKCYENGMTPLMVAVEMGNINIITAMIEAGADVNMKNSQNEHSLLIAIRNDHAEIAEMLLKHGANLKTPHTYRNAHIIANLHYWKDPNDYIRMLKALHRGGADIDAKGSNGETELYRAALNSDTSKVKAFLELGANTESSNGTYKLRPLDAAVNHKLNGQNTTIIKILLEAGANPNISARPDVIFSPLHRAIINNLDEALDELLKHKDIKINEVTKDVNENTPLLMAANCRAITVCEKLIDAGADISKKNGQGRSIIHLMAGTYETDFLIKLLQNKKLNKDINLTDKNGYTALHCAAQLGNKSNIEVLIKHRADILAIDNLGYTPLYYAIINDKKHIIESFTLANKKLDIFNSPLDNIGNTPLHLSAHNNKQEILELLLKLGADIKIHDKNNISPLTKAISNGSMSVINTIILHLEKNNIALDDIKDKNNATPLHFAIKNNASEYIIEKLLKANSDINKKDKFGNTPLSLAKENAIKFKNDNIFFRLSGQRLNKSNSFNPPKPKGF